MTLELKALGNSCNLDCVYCYQDPMRKAGNARASKTYDLELMMEIADASGRTQDGYTIFGGEALLMPKKDLEYILKQSFDKYGKGALQTNGSLIDEDHIRMFLDYNVYVGISVDGPNELNGLRVPKSAKQSVDEMTKKSVNNILLLKRAGIQTGVIITIHKLNGTPETLPRLINFIEWLRDIGVQGGNIHMLEVDSVEAEPFMLTEEENTSAFLLLAEYFNRSENRNMRWIPFTEMESMQDQSVEVDSTGCVWNSCDSMNTQSVYGIEGNGQLSNCGMVNKEGIEWTKGENPFTKEMNIDLSRDVILYNTPQDQKGCGGCPFFLMCNGYCVGSAIDGDWRNRSVHCHTLKGLFSFYEKTIEESGSVPFSKRLDRKDIERKYIKAITENPSNRPRISLLANEKLVFQTEVRG